MNQYIFLRRMRGPIFLLMFGVTAILDVYTSIDYGRSWPLYLIVWGMLKLAENAILAQNPPPPPGQWPGGQAILRAAILARIRVRIRARIRRVLRGSAGADSSGYGPEHRTGTTSTTAIVPSPGEERR